MPPDPSSDEPLFHVSHIDRVYTLKTETLSERYTNTRLALWGTAASDITQSCHILSLLFCNRTAWVQKIKAASEIFIETEKKKREKAYQGGLIIYL